MESINNSSSPFFTSDTIAAIATAPGMGAIAIVRLSGKDALKIVKKIFSGPVEKYKSHTAHFGKVFDENKQIIDSVLLLIMRSPRSYTGEDIIEIHCHGGSFISKKVMQALIKAGARAANPGEFTYRAFLNKKIDLLQAEAVQEIISASNDVALKAAENQIEGALSSIITSFQKELVEISSMLEVYLDFSEEDLERESIKQLTDRLAQLNQKMEKLALTFDEGKVFFEGLNLAIIGTPNVGKSSLMNALCKRKRSIVTPFAGTTRDTIEEIINLCSIQFKIIDTAGIRKDSDPIEEEGIKRSKKVFQETDLVLLLLDASKKLSEDDLQLISSADPEKTIFVWNKIDLKPTYIHDLAREKVVTISAKENQGLETLKKIINEFILEKNPASKEEIILTKLRHKQALSAALSHSKQALKNFSNKNLSFEFIVSDLREALNSLGTIIGHNITEDILSSIFANFCIGK